MIDASNPNYSETLQQIDELRSSVEEIERNLQMQVSQGLYEKFVSSKNVLMNWIDEIEFTIADYSR